jgi:uncharacterized membrane protein YkgB
MAAGLAECAGAMALVTYVRASALGSALAVGMFFTTLSFLVTTPGVWESSAGGFPALSASPGQALIKDLALLGISLRAFGEALKASEQRREGHGVSAVRHLRSVLNSCRTKIRASIL